MSIMHLLDYNGLQQCAKTEEICKKIITRYYL